MPWAERERESSVNAGKRVGDVGRGASSRVLALLSEAGVGGIQANVGGRIGIAQDGRRGVWTGIELRVEMRSVSLETAFQIMIMGSARVRLGPCLSEEGGRESTYLSQW
jgi:hypothetical protein